MTNGSATVLTMSLAKETKGTYVYNEVDGSGVPVTSEAGAKVPTLYIRKGAFNGSGAPAKLKLTIEAA